MTNLNPPVLLDPWEYEENLPTKLSPSSLNKYVQCPLTWFNTYLLGNREPGTTATTQGSMFHFAAERAFDLAPEDRTTPNIVPFLHQYWTELTEPDVKGLDAADSDKKLAAAIHALSMAQELPNMFAACERFINTWLELEPVSEMEPQQLLLPNGQVVDGRELHVEASVGDFELQGYIDRVDRWVGEDGEAHYRVCDYKTSKALPSSKSAKASQRLQLGVYGLLMWEMHGVAVEQLRIIYPAVGGTKAIWDIPFSAEDRENVREEVLRIRAEMLASAKSGHFQEDASILCDYCPLQTAGCPKPGGRRVWNR